MREKRSSAQKKGQFAASLAEFGDTRSLVGAALLLAIGIVLSYFTIQVSEFLKIGISSLANELSALLFGPVVASIAGAAGDVIKYLLHPTGPFFPGFTISAAAAGVLYGLVLYRRPVRLWRVTLANTLVTVMVNILLNTYWLTLLYGKSYAVMLPARIAKNLVQLPLDILLFYLVAKALDKAHLFHREEKHT